MKFLSPPPPFMVISGKLEVGDCNSGECCDDEKNNKHYKENAVQSVNLMSPHTGKYILKFNVYSTEREKPCHCHLRDS